LDKKYAEIDEEYKRKMGQKLISATQARDSQLQMRGTGMGGGIGGG